MRDFIRSSNRVRDTRQPSLTLPEVSHCLGVCSAMFHIPSSPSLSPLFTHPLFSPALPPSSPLPPPSLSLQFVSFLFSKRNSVLNEEHATVYQDMDRPLSHYWMASSHNTSVAPNNAHPLPHYQQSVISHCFVMVTEILAQLYASIVKIPHYRLRILNSK